MFKGNQVILAETTSGAVKQEDSNPLLGGWGRQSGAAEGWLRKVMSCTLCNLQLLLIFDLKYMKKIHIDHCMTNTLKYIYLVSLLALIPISEK